MIFTNIFLSRQVDLNTSILSTQNFARSEKPSRTAKLKCRSWPLTTNPITIRYVWGKGRTSQSQNELFLLSKLSFSYSFQLLVKGSNHALIYNNHNYYNFVEKRFLLHYPPQSF